MAAFRLAWWVMAVITALGLLPLLLLRLKAHPCRHGGRVNWPDSTFVSRIAATTSNSLPRRWPMFAFGWPFIPTPDLAVTLKNGVPQAMFNEAALYPAIAASNRLSDPVTSAAAAVPSGSRCLTRQRKIENHESLRSEQREFVVACLGCARAVPFLSSRSLKE
jgi:hypothetical protein